MGPSARDDCRVEAPRDSEPRGSGEPRIQISLQISELQPMRENRAHQDSSISQAKNPCVSVGHKGAMNAALFRDPLATLAILNGHP